MDIRFRFRIWCTEWIDNCHLGELDYVFVGVHIRMLGVWWVEELGFEEWNVSGLEGF